MSFYITFTPEWITYPAMFVFIVGILVVSCAVVGFLGFCALACYWRAAKGRDSR
jgi:hypothetical protein